MQNIRRKLRAFKSVPLRERLWLKRRGFKPSAYVLYQFGSKDEKTRDAYLSDDQANLLHRVNAKGPAELLKNKLAFHRFLEASGCTVTFPALRAIIRQGRVTAAASPHQVISPDRIFDETDAVVVKPLAGYRGRGVHFLRKSDFLGDRNLTSMVSEISRQDRDEFIVVDHIGQAAYSADVSPFSSNTIRIVCMRLPLTREVVITSAVHRFGTIKTAPIDNFSKGGLSCAIDLETGTLGRGAMHPSKNNTKLTFVDHHPDTGTRIRGKAIPHWRDLITDVTSLMNWFPDLEFVAWDMLPTDRGWCVIEGNPLMDIDLIQVHGGFLADDRVRHFVDYHLNGSRSTITLRAIG